MVSHAVSHPSLSCLLGNSPSHLVPSFHLLLYPPTPSYTVGTLPRLSDYTVDPFLVIKPRRNFVPTFLKCDTHNPVYSGTLIIYKSLTILHVLLMAYRSSKSSSGSPSSSSNNASSLNASPNSQNASLAPMARASDEGESLSRSSSARGTPSRVPIDLPRSQAASKGGCW